MNLTQENWAAFQMLHLSILILLYYKDRNGQELENNIYRIYKLKYNKHVKH